MSKTKTKKSVVAVKKPKPRTKRRLTKPEARVALAKEVLRLANSGAIKLKMGEWLTVFNQNMICSYRGEIPDREFPFYVSNAINNAVNEKRCSCNAIGALFVAMCTLKLKTLVAQDPEDTWTYFDDLQDSPLRAFFSLEQLDIIDFSSEGYDLGAVSLCSLSDQAVCCAFSHLHKNNYKERVCVLMRNIIRNNGTFVPQQDVSKEDILDQLKNL